MKWYNEKDAVALPPPSSSLLLCFSSFLSTPFSRWISPTGRISRCVSSFFFFFFFCRSSLVSPFIALFLFELSLTLRNTLWCYLKKLSIRVCRYNRRFENFRSLLRCFIRYFNWIVRLIGVDSTNKSFLVQTSLFRKQKFGQGLNRQWDVLKDRKIHIA